MQHARIACTLLHEQFGLPSQPIEWEQELEQAHKRAQRLKGMMPSQEVSISTSTVEAKMQALATLGQEYAKRQVWWHQWRLFAYLDQNLVCSAGSARGTSGTDMCVHVRHRYTLSLLTGMSPVRVMSGHFEVCLCRCTSGANCFRMDVW